MIDLNLSKVEIPLKSKSMSTQEPPKMDIISIKQIGDYILGEEIGSGAFGKVLLGKHILTEEKVAIKILDKMILNQTPEDYELVKKEISILKLVKHKYIVQLYEILQTAQHIFIIMEYCEGKEILDYILTRNRLSELESLKYFQQLINCLFYLHSQNIAHRDVKIDNMLLDANKDLKLIDFGLSTKYTDDDLLDQPCGTVVYAAPEVLEGKEYHGMLADVWSSGIVLFGMIAGYLPFSDKDDEVNKQLVIKGQIAMPEFFSDKVKDLLKHMLDVNPMTRYTLQEIKDHPWFNMVDCLLIPGIIIGYNIIPIDEKIIDICVTYNKDKNDVINSIRNNKHDSNSALYYLLIKKLQKKGVQSISDMCSDEFIDFVLDENNLINKEKNNNQEEISVVISEEITNQNLNRENLNNEEGDIKENKNDVNKENSMENENEIPENMNNKEEIKNLEDSNNKDEEKICFSSPEKRNNRTSKNLELSKELKNTNSQIIKKNYDIDESYPAKEIKFENNEKIDIEKLIIYQNENKIRKFGEKGILIDKNNNSFEEIVLEEPKRMNTDVADNNKIIEKIMENLENNVNKIKILDIDINNTEIENNLKEKNKSKIKENQEIFNKTNNTKEKRECLTKANNSKIINIENKTDLKNKDIKSKEKEKIKDKINEKKQKNIIKNEENLYNIKEKNGKLSTKQKEKNKKIDKSKEKINTKNQQLSNTTKKKLYFNEKSNSILKQLKKNLTKQKKLGPMTPITEYKAEKNKSIFRLENKNKFNNHKNSSNKQPINFSSRNSKNKHVLINDKIKYNQKIPNKKNNFSNFKKKTSNQIFNIINIFNNNFNSTESEIKMKNYYFSPQKNKETININNLQKKFDEIYVQHIKDINYNKTAFSSDKNNSHSKKDNERNLSKPNKRVNTKTNNITIIIQNKKGFDKNNITGNLLKPIINFDNKNIINLSHSKSKKKNKEINNYEIKSKNNKRTKNLESSVKMLRYKSPIGVRELSESPKQKYLNNKTRLTKIPWKMKKKGIDKKMDSKEIYEQYKSKIKNPFTQNIRKISNVNRSIKSSFSNSIRSSLCETKKINKLSFANNIKEIRSSIVSPKNLKPNKKISRIKKDNKLQRKKGKNSRENIFMNNSKTKDNLILNSDLKVTNVNSLFSMSNILTNINNTDNKKSILDIKKNSEKFLYNDCLSINLKKKFILNENEFNNIYIPMNLCCLFFKKSDMTNYRNYLISKFKKCSISFIQKKNNCFICNKNGYNCEIQINKININNKHLSVQLEQNENRLTEKENLYYLKMYGKKETFGINTIFKKFVLNLDN